MASEVVRLDAARQNSGEPAPTVVFTSTQLHALADQIRALRQVGSHFQL